MSKSIRNILLVVLLLALLSTVSYCASPYDTESAQIVEIKDTITGSGFILRRETLVEKNITGVFEPLVKDGTRVGKGSGVGTVISGNLDKKLAVKLSEITERIEEIKNSDSIANLYASDDARIYSAMKEISASVRKFSYDENFLRAAEYKNQLNALIEKKYSQGSLDSRDDLLVSLEAEKYSIEQQLGGIRSEIVAPAAGIFYTTLDGLESLCDEETLLSYTVEDINSFSKTLKAYEEDDLVVGKISDNYTWYIAAVIPATDASKIEAGESISISVDDSQFIKATVFSVNAEGEDAAIIIKCNRNVEGITEKRTADFEIELGGCSGIYIPAPSLRVLDNITGVYVMDANNSTYFRCVDIIYESKDYYIARNKYTPPDGCNYKALKVHEDILVNPEAVRNLDENTKESK
ncbi:MAG: hypothetical protein IKA17_05765 [Clostridia bacterium]|nr:hypothetical protein [Clostridia bacterium]